MAEPDLIEWDFDPEIVLPVAQVTVVDASVGDSNLVDFCRLQPEEDGLGNGSYPQTSWRRTLIDTGPASFGRPNQSICSTLAYLVARQYIPSINASDFHIPNLAELQITHPDNDHIGNAVGFLQKICSTGEIDSVIWPGTRYVDRIKGCRVYYCKIPSLYEAPSIQITDLNVGFVTVGSAKIFINRATFTASVDKDWVRAMEQAGFTVDVRLTRGNSCSVWTRATDGAEWEDQDPDRANVRVLRYQESASLANLRPKLLAKVNIYVTTESNMTAIKITRDKKGRGTARVSGLETELVVPNREVQIDDQMRKDNLRTIKTFKLPWEKKSSAKKPKAVKAVWDPNLLASMVSQQRVTTLSSRPVPPASSSTSNSLFTATPVGTVRQVASLHDGIKTLNGVVDVADNPQLWESVPRKGAMIKTQTPGMGKQRTLGPTRELYSAMMREIMIGRYKLDENNLLAASDVSLDGATLNRSSVITMFERKDKDTTTTPPRDYSFTMLFTGDAFDNQCDIRDTLIAWKNDPDHASMHVDVLKVPHHGSDNTASSGFYTFCRAYVYLVSGSHRDTNGNPKPSSLKAIVRGFYQKTAPGGFFRIFFSNPFAAEDYVSTSGDTVQRSAIGALLADPVLRPGGPDYKYEMYHLRARGLAGYADFGQILFGKDERNEFAVKFDATPGTGQWVKAV